MRSNTLAFFNSMILISQCVIHAEERGGSKTAADREAEKAQTQAIARLRHRGHVIHEMDSGLSVGLKPGGKDQKLTAEDVKDLNQLRDMVCLRIVGYWGVTPAVFKRFAVFPKVRVVGIHYGMPAKSLKYLSKFPNVEILQIWGDQYVSCDFLPELPKLRRFEHESSEGEKFTDESVKRLVSCRNLEEIEILLPISDEGVRLLKTLPKLRKLRLK